MRNDLDDRKSARADCDPILPLASANSAPGADATIVAPPLHWWRTWPAPAFSEAHLAELAETLSVFSILGEPRWRAAAAGDPDAAIGVALKVTKPATWRPPSPTS